ncbi:hypothetical protein QBC44DRAFT_139124 [Cladorrhinum sp. PSN332]|nr:hypothetical protein QBC44DRAFT_139124 [Cladorrhinum sp. PSN332]
MAHDFRSPAQALAIPEQPPQMVIPRLDIIGLDGLQDLHDFDVAEWPDAPDLTPIDDEDDGLIDLVSSEPPNMSPQLRSDAQQQISEENKAACEEAVIACFPDICRDYVKIAALEHNWNAEQLINHILEKQENGNSYPKRISTLKRKRTEEVEDNEEAIRRKFDNVNPVNHPRGSEYYARYTATAKVLLKKAFPQLYAGDVEKLLKENNNRIYPTFLACDKACTDAVNPNPPFRIKQYAHKADPEPEAPFLETATDGGKDAIEEFRAARTVVQTRLVKEAEVKRLEREELDNIERARQDGTLFECGCCCDEFAVNRMVQCNGEPFHSFCRYCARRQAETQVGLSKYELACMDTSGCTAGFDNDQRELFLDEKLTIALDRIEKEAVLRMAGIENLESCPNCPYAAEYPPIEVNKEFKCENPDCGKIICRHCRQDTHIPKTCEEAARDTGHSARRVIEEAMSAALIRECNRCGTPFIKEAGCNKMTCTRNGCHNVQCYVCSKSCDYTHFDDTGRGGRTGNCPLFDRVEERHQEEVNTAMEEARKKVTEENPDVKLELLDIKFSDKVVADDQKRNAVNPGPPAVPPAGPRPRHNPIG